MALKGNVYAVKKLSKLCKYTEKTVKCVNRGYMGQEG